MEILIGALILVFCFYAFLSGNSATLFSGIAWITLLGFTKDYFVVLFISIFIYDIQIWKDNPTSKGALSSIASLWLFFLKPKATKKLIVTPIVCVVLFILWVIYIVVNQNKQFVFNKVLVYEVFFGFIFLILFYNTLEFIINRFKINNETIYTGKIDELKHAKASQYFTIYTFKLEERPETTFNITILTYLYLKIMSKKQMEFKLKEGFLGIEYANFYNTKTKARLPLT